jgi:hypothetical protein
VIKIALLHADRVIAKSIGLRPISRFQHRRQKVKIIFDDGVDIFLLFLKAGFGSFFAASL